MKRTTEQRASAALFPPMKPTEDQITQYLDSMFVTLCDMATDTLGVDSLTPELAYDLILGHVFDYAVGVDWVPEPPEGPVSLGSWDVPKDYKDAFLERAGDTVSYYAIDEREEARRAEAAMKPKRGWRQPTPIKTIKRFCIRNTTAELAIHATTAFVKIISGEDPRTKGYPDRTNQKRIQRLLDPNKHPETKLKIPVASEREFAVKMKEKMAKYDPRYADMDIRDLMWVPDNKQPESSD